MKVLRCIRAYALWGWHALWLRKGEDGRVDEFHHTLDLDYRILQGLYGGERWRYLASVTRRRALAHKDELETAKRTFAQRFVCALKRGVTAHKDRQ